MRRSLTAQEYELRGNTVAQAALLARLHNTGQPVPVKGPQLTVARRLEKHRELVLTETGRYPYRWEARLSK